MEILLFLLLVIFILLLIVVYFLWLHRQILFYPVREHVWTPSSQQRDFVEFRTKEGISGWYFLAFSNAPVVLFCHGTDGNISYRDYVIELTQRAKINLILFDYSGYGKSRGLPGLSQVYSDAAIIYRYVISELHIAPSRLIVWGESLGGAAATYIAAKYRCGKLILWSTFANYDTLVNETRAGIAMRILGQGLKYLTDPMDNALRLRQIKCPVVIVHSRDDTLIIYKNAEMMYAAIPHHQKELIEIKGNHSTPIVSDEIVHRLFSFCGMGHCRSSCDDIFEKLIARKNAAGNTFGHILAQRK